MKKISLLTLLISLALILAGVSFATQSNIRGQFSHIKSGDTNIGLDNLEIEIVHVSSNSEPEELILTGSLGDIIDFDFEIEGYLYHIYDGKVSTALERQFVVSKSTYIIVVTNETQIDSKIYIDSNGKLLDAKFGVDLSFDGITPTKPGFLFDTFVSIYEEEVHSVVKATYNSNVTDLIPVSITGGVANPANPSYNDVVTITPNDPSNFKYWKD